jgi:hypothetical protein
MKSVTFLLDIYFLFYTLIFSLSNSAPRPDTAVHVKSFQADWNKSEGFFYSLDGNRVKLHSELAME